MQNYRKTTRPLQNAMNSWKISEDEKKQKTIFKKDHSLVFIKPRKYRDYWGFESEEKANKVKKFILQMDQKYFPKYNKMWKARQCNAAQ